MYRKVVRLVSLIGVLLLFSVWTFSQAETGVINGTVTDTSNAVVRDARCTCASDVLRSHSSRVVGRMLLETNRVRCSLIDPDDSCLFLGALQTWSTGNSSKINLQPT
jgi:hypothetical protein